MTEQANSSMPVENQSPGPSDHQSDEDLRIHIDDSATSPTLLFLATSMVWLIIGSLFGVVVALKFSLPDWLGSVPALTFGRLRPAHLNTVVFGFVSLAGAGMVIWLTGRLCRTHIRWTGLLYISVIIWNLGLLLGTALVLAGYSEGMEWLEFPLIAVVPVALGFVLFAASILKTFANRSVEHIYISLWYILASLVWFPILYVIGNGRFYQGVSQAAMNWWFAHNLLTVWVTPLGLAGAYYFIPKVIGRPIYSYYLGLLGFWSFALFYNWNGLHHLVGGPVPTWAVSISIVASLLMFIPVITVAVNHHMTAFGNLKLVRYSPTLRFVVFGAMSYTVVSLQGSLEATRTMQEIVHFTHYTVGHAHLGVYSFASMILFGAMYYILPRIAKWEWPYPALIKVHFWLTAVGVLLYFVAMEVGGWLQGMAMVNGAVPFIDSVIVTRPWLWGRSIGGVMMTIGNILFAYHFALVVYRAGPIRFAPGWVRKAEGQTS
ncbi:MAG: cytochrome-c oxidase [Bacteroidetes bacterium]|nr:cytochrome-c oxidase [Bacteroidota bacterium]